MGLYRTPVNKRKTRVKHVTTISRNHVARADKWEDFICAFAQALNTLLSFFGGVSPLLNFIDSKCEIPTPNP